MNKHPKRIGLAIVGAGRVGLIRGEIAARFAGRLLGWRRSTRTRGNWSRESRRGFVTAISLASQRPEVTAVVVSDDEHLHVDPIRPHRAQLPMMVEKPLATDPRSREPSSDPGSPSDVVSSTRSASAAAGSSRRKVRTGRCAT